MVVHPYTNTLDGVDVADLVARCVDGDDEARALFISEYSPHIERAVARKLASMRKLPPIRSDVEDIRNDILVKLMADNFKLLTGLRKPKALNAWLVSVTRNMVVDYVRRYSARMKAQGLTVREEPDAEYTTPANAAIARESVLQARKLLESLSVQDRLVIELFYLQGMKYTEIAEITSQNINTVAARLRRAKVKLRKLLEERGDVREGQ